MQKVRESQSPRLGAFFSVGCRYRLRFVRFVRLLSRLYVVDLQVPNVGVGDSALVKLKEFCGKLLEGDDHPWRRATRRLSADNRKSLAMSLFLYRKVLPSPKPQLAAYAEKMSTPSEGPPSDFVAFAQRELRKMFPEGWDRQLYPNACLSATVPETSCAQLGKGKGGCRSYVLGGSHRWSSHHDYVVEVLSAETAPTLCDARLTAVDTGGKWRIVSSADVDMNILRPLHSAIYNRLSRFSWLLRGEATVNSFRSFTCLPGQVYVSGDYTSATDNLNLGVQQCILRGVLEGARHVPDGVKRRAFESQSVGLVLPCSTSCRGCAVCERFTQRRGQLMGNLLSFPLLCIVNYLGFRYYGGTETRDLPVKVNGDDIVFRSSQEVCDRWMSGVRGAGLTLSPGKTMVDRRYFSINSKLCKGGTRSVRLIPSVRATAFGFKEPEDPVASFASRWERVRKDFPCGKLRLAVLGEEFMRLNVRYVVASCRSVTRGLGSLFPYSAFACTNLWRRECWYLALEKEEPLPLSPAQAAKLRVPEGWRCARVEKVSKEMLDASRGMGAEFVAQAWTPYDSITDAELKVREERYRERVAMAPRYVPDNQERSYLLRSRTRLGEIARVKLPGDLVERGHVLRPKSRSIEWKAKLLGLSVQNARRFLKPSVPCQGGRGWTTSPAEILRDFRPRGQRIWLPIGFNEPTFSCAREDGEPGPVYTGVRFVRGESLVPLNTAALLSL